MYSLVLTLNYFYLLHFIERRVNIPLARAMLVLYPEKFQTQSEKLVYIKKNYINK